MRGLIFISSALLCTNVIASENSEVSKGNRVLKSTKSEMTHNRYIQSVDNKGLTWLAPFSADEAMKAGFYPDSTFSDKYGTKMNVAVFQYQRAKYFCDNLWYMGYSDWRLPSKYELSDFAKANYPISTYPLQWPASQYYVSSTIMGSKVYFYDFVGNRETSSYITYNPSGYAACVRNLN
ncbi:hypothetical protein [Cysteiniphilum marinum]|uniref:hypothetical protein n=1 Tax=Cysteiniphilum marinum TaxID=2774191 RepID=UPI00193A7D41|nr:hypothetical protein [Cysteiniphilum marinum]